jgi:hypothetical protein
MRRALAILAACAALAGCSTTGKFDNVLLCTLNCDRAFVGSLVGPFGFTTELRAQDAREIQAMREKVRAAEAMLSSAAQRPVRIEWSQP